MNYDELTTKHDRLTWLATNRIVEKILNSWTIQPDHKADLIAEIYLELCEKSDDKIEGKTFSQTRNYIITIARNSYFGAKGQFNLKYLRYDNNKTELNEERTEY